MTRNSNRKNPLAPDFKLPEHLLKKRQQREEAEKRDAALIAETPSLLPESPAIDPRDHEGFIQYRFEKATDEPQKSFTSHSRKKGRPSAGTIKRAQVRRELLAALDELNLTRPEDAPQFSVRPISYTDPESGRPQSRTVVFHGEAPVVVCMRPADALCFVRGAIMVPRCVESEKAAAAHTGQQAASGGQPVEQAEGAGEDAPPSSLTEMRERMRRAAERLSGGAGASGETDAADEPEADQ